MMSAFAVVSPTAGLSLLVVAARNSVPLVPLALKLVAVASACGSSAPSEPFEPALIR